MKKFLLAFVLLALGVLIGIQKGPDGYPLIEGYLGLGFAALGCMVLSLAVLVDEMIEVSWR